MRVIVNGQPRDVPAGCSVADLIRELQLDGRACAAEVNESLVPRREHASRTLRENDRVEVVTLVGGG